MSQVGESVFDAIRELLLKGKEENYEALVIQKSETIRKLLALASKIQKVAPDVALSPYVLRAVRIAQAHAQSNGTSLTAAA
ncbi:MAG: hypothetical protein HUU29_01555 [Planctomycetaceae bacterium]|nr:hypothetical protein [Planctomycetaceae bacterium]